MENEKALSYLKEKYKGKEITLESIEKKYSKQYGHEYYIYYKKNGVTHKEILTQHKYKTL